ncbi:hypothetical protein M8044_000337 [Columbia Basin potato purple top phytoplasma]|uniref:Uncharacterized protein n=1 Tax=Columbia Basin potato purple top phytoplasma TaxID=307134 RepID=A0ABT5L935_9MOLU|nr:hypothetical protein [Columbia Basin potato purple top phytoplasma]
MKFKIIFLIIFLFLFSKIYFNKKYVKLIFI